MDRSDLTISKEDLDEIFGGNSLLSKKKSEPAAPPRDKKSAEKTAVEAPPDKKEEDMFDGDAEVDELIKRAGEIEKQFSPPPAPAGGLEFRDFLDEEILIQIIEAFEEIRKVIYADLSPRIGTRPVNNMFLRTLEKAAVKYTVLKNTNWDSSGKLREDGSINPGKFLKNVDFYSDKIKEIDRETEEALGALLYMRVKSVKLGLGSEKYEEVKKNFLKRLRVAEAGYKSGVINFIKNKIIEPAIRRADHEA